MVRPVEGVVLGGPAPLHPPDGGGGAGEHELAQRLTGGHFEHRPQGVDVGAVQRCRVPQPRTGVDGAVENYVATVHRRAHRGGVEEVAGGVVEVEAGQCAEIAGFSREDADVLAVLDELPDQSGTEETVAADDELHRPARPPGTRSSIAAALRDSIASNMAVPRSVGCAAAEPKTMISGAWMRLAT